MPRHTPLGIFFLKSIHLRLLPAIKLLTLYGFHDRNQTIPQTKIFVEHHYIFYRNAQSQTSLAYTRRRNGIPG